MPATVSPSFEARFSKKCGAGCGQPIAKGDRAVFVSNDATGVRAIVHAACAVKKGLTIPQGGDGASLDSVLGA